MYKIIMATLCCLFLLSCSPAVEVQRVIERVYVRDTVNAITPQKKDSSSVVYITNDSLGLYWYAKYSGIQSILRFVANDNDSLKGGIDSLKKANGYLADMINRLKGKLFTTVPAETIKVPIRDTLSAEFNKNVVKKDFWGDITAKDIMIFVGLVFFLGFISQFFRR
jgi:kynureninase